MSVIQNPQVSRSVEQLARAGYAAKGVVYGAVGVLAARAAVGAGGQVGGSENALGAIGDQAFGKILLVIIGLGLLGFVLWRVVQAVSDPERHGSDPKGLAKRAGYLGSGLTYLALALAALGGAARRSGGDDKSGQVAKAMELPFGDVLVALAGLGVMVFAATQVYAAFQRKFVKHYDRARMTPQQLSVATRIGQLGLMARGVTFFVMGGYLALAGVQSDPGEARGLGGALAALGEQPFGQLLLGGVAVGLVCYGIYCLSEARWRVIQAT